MNRILALLTLLCVPSFTIAQTPTAEAKQATLQWLYSLQQANGAFAASNEQNALANLGTTSAALRVIKYFGGTVPDKAKCETFVKSCYQESGGIALTPGGKPDIISTFQGISALTELGVIQPGKEQAQTQEAQKFFA